jgi:hypothetical protein
MTFAEVFDFAYNGFLIPIAQGLAAEVEGEDFIEILKRAAADSATRRGRRVAQGLSSNDFAAFTAWARDPDHFWQNVLTFEIVEDSERVFELRITQCLWAETFRKRGAVDMGYATVCHPDFAYCRAFNPKIKLVRSKTLMEGHDCCNHRWVYGTGPIVGPKALPGGGRASRSIDNMEGIS